MFITTAAHQLMNSSVPQSLTCVLGGRAPKKRGLIQLKDAKFSPVFSFYKPPCPQPEVFPSLGLVQVMLVGDSGVGKTCLLVRFKDGAFLAGSFISTVGIDFRVSMNRWCEKRRRCENNSTNVSSGNALSGYFCTGRTSQRSRIFP